MKKVSVLFVLLLLMAGNVWSHKPSTIPMICHADTIEGPRSFVFTPIVTLDETVLVFDFSSTTASQVIIMDQNNSNQVVYYESFASTTQVFVDLEDEGVGEGRYLLWLFALGKWWEGELVLTEDNNNE